MTDARHLIERAKAAGAPLRLAVTADGQARLPEELRAEIKAAREAIVKTLAREAVAPPLVAYVIEPQAPASRSPAWKLGDREPVRLRARPKEWGPVTDEPVTGDFCEICRLGIFVETARGWRCSWCIDCPPLPGPRLPRTLFCEGN